jgi:ubiquinone/menaquinone biosynthesis C-methylase UbiE
LNIGWKIRRILEDPGKRMRSAGVTDGQRVADIGAGEGYFAIAASKIVGRNGIIYAIEPDEKRSDRIKKRTIEKAITNIRVIKARAEDLSDIPSEEIDIAVSMYSLHHIEDKLSALREIKRVLKKGGVFYIRDFMRSRILRHGTRNEDIDRLLEWGFSDTKLFRKGGFVEIRLAK